MLSFKEFLNEMFLFEATSKHFSHIAGFDENNPEHQDLVHAFNQSGFPTNHASHIKSMDELKDKVAPKLQAIHQARAEEKEHQAAIARGDAELVHHDPEKGIKVFKVKNQAGGCAVGKGTKWCIADPLASDDMVKYYDPKGDSSHVIHLDKEKGNLSRIAMIGVNYRKPHDAGWGGNFQDKGNNSVSDSDWNHLRKKYKLDSIPALSGIRGIAPGEKDKDELEKNLTHTDPAVRMKALEHPNVNGNDISRALKDKHPGVRAAAIGNSNGIVTSAHISSALEDEDPEVRKAAVANLSLTLTPGHISKALEDEHPMVRETAISKKNATAANIDKALSMEGDKYKNVRRAAISNPNATAEHIDKALEDKHPMVRAAAIYHRNATIEHFQTALKDSDETVKTIAQMRKDRGDFL